MLAIGPERGLAPWLSHHTRERQKSEGGGLKSEHRNRLQHHSPIFKRPIYATMFCPASRRCLTRLLRDPARGYSIPTFLVPAFSQPSRAQCFSSTAPAPSRIGGTPISIPPEVTLNLIDLPRTQLRGRAKEAPTTAIEVSGPLGIYHHPFPKIYVV